MSVLSRITHGMLGGDGGMTVAAPLDHPLTVEIGEPPMSINVGDETIDVALLPALDVEIGRDAIVIDVGETETQIEV